MNPSLFFVPIAVVLPEKLRKSNSISVVLPPPPLDQNVLHRLRGPPPLSPHLFCDGEGKISCGQPAPISREKGRKLSRHARGDNLNWSGLKDLVSFPSVLPRPRKRRRRRGLKPFSAGGVAESCQMTLSQENMYFYFIPGTQG